MQRFSKSWPFTLGIALSLVWLNSSCSRFEESGLPGSASSMARNQIMLVRQEPSTFGYYRLDTHLRNYPDLALFVSKRGMPDFLAEAHSDRQNYFIIYYLRDRQAFACRNSVSRPRNLEFAGPYPISDRESKLLKALEQQHKAIQGAG